MPQYKQADYILGILGYQCFLSLYQPGSLTLNYILSTVLTTLKLLLSMIRVLPTSYARLCSIV